MSRRYDALVVGAGIVGAALGERLTACGLGKVLILEKEAMPGSGATGRSAGGIRQQFGDEAKIRAARFGFSVFAAFRDRYGLDPGFKKNGYLILHRRKDRAEDLKKAVALQNRLGLDTRFLEPRAVAELFPPLFTEDLKGASFNGTDGYLDPHAVVQGFLKAFRKRGGEIEFGVKALRLIEGGGRVRGVSTAKGDIEAGAILLASGPHTGGLLEAVGIRIPIRTCRRQIFTSGPVEGIPDHWPLILDEDAPFYFRPEGDGLIMSLAEEEEMNPPADGNDVPLSRKHLGELARRASHRCPLLGEAEIRSGWAGLRCLTRDGRPLLGPVPGKEGLFVAAGFSGHGITLSPYAAEFLAREVTGDPMEKEERKDFLPDRLMKPMP